MTIKMEPSLIFLEDENFIVKTSQIPASGLGLYTKKSWKKGERVIQYLGEYYTYNMGVEPQGDYCYAPSRGQWIDAEDMTTSSWGRYVNAPRKSKFKSNLRWVNKVYKVDENMPIHGW